MCRSATAGWAGQQVGQPRRFACSHARVIPHGKAWKPWGMSGATKSSASLPAATHRVAMSNVSSSRWSALPTEKKAGGRSCNEANAGEIDGSRRSSRVVPGR